MKNFKNKVEEAYQEALCLCKVLIERYYRPCGLEEVVKERIHNLTLLWMRCEEESEKEVGGIRVLFLDIEREVGQAEYLESEKDMPKCVKLRRGLERPPPKRGALGNYFIRMALPDL